MKKTFYIPKKTESLYLHLTDILGFNDADVITKGIEAFCEINKINPYKAPERTTYLVEKSKEYLSNTSLPCPVCISPHIKDCNCALTGKLLTHIISEWDK